MTQLYPDLAQLNPNSQSRNPHDTLSEAFAICAVDETPKNVKMTNCREEETSTSIDDNKVNPDIDTFLQARVVILELVIT